MNIHTTVREILLDADRRLRQAIAESATDGDLDAVDLARNAAGRLRQMINGLEENEQPTVGNNASRSITANGRSAKMTIQSITFKVTIFPESGGQKRNGNHMSTKWLETYSMKR